MAMAATADQNANATQVAKELQTITNKALRQYQRKRLSKTARTVDIG